MNAATAERRPSTEQISGLVERVTSHSDESGFCAFTFLGFTHFCGKRRSNGAFTVWRKTAKKRMVAKLHAIKAELRLRMHEPAAEVGAWLRKVVTGYYQYHAVPGNIDRLSVFGQRLRRLWWITLRRRSQQPVTRDRVTRIATHWIPAPRVLHPYPVLRFLATHPRWEPYALTHPYGSVRGAVSERPSLPRHLTQHLAT